MGFEGSKTDLEPQNLEKDNDYVNALFGRRKNAGSPGGQVDSEVGVRIFIGIEPGEAALMGLQGELGGEGQVDDTAGGGGSVVHHDHAGGGIRLPGEGQE